MNKKDIDMLLCYYREYDKIRDNDLDYIRGVWSPEKRYCDG